MGDMFCTDSLCRADTEGAVELLAVPHLPPMPRFRPSLLPEVSEVEESCNGSAQILENAGLTDNLLSLFARIRQFSGVIKNAFAYGSLPIDPFAFDEDTMMFQRELIDLVVVQKTGDEMSRACLLGMLLYMITITRQPAVWARSSQVLVERLESLLDDDHDVAEIMDCRLLKWLSIIGAMTSVERSPERATFIKYLTTTTRRDLSTAEPWACTVADLEKIAWVRGIHDRHGKVHGAWWG